MKVVVLGAGIIGVTSAYQLAKAGHQVTVVDRRSGPALETSFANAGQISFGYCSPWAAPGIPIKALRWLMMEHAPLILRPKPEMAMLSWLIAMLSNCTSRRYATNKGRMLRLAEYSRRSLGELQNETGILYDHGIRGTLQLFRKQAQLDASGKDVRALVADGVPFEILDRAGCVRAEPSLGRVPEKFVGGLLTPRDETGDCFKFNNALASKCAELGVTFLFGNEVDGLEIERGKAKGVVCKDRRLAADAVVVAMGSYTPLLLKPYGIRLPVYPVKGYSLTMPIVDPSRSPVSTVMDETYKIAITRLGDRIRVGGMAEISGYSAVLRQAQRRTLEYSVTDLFPGGDLNRGSFWSGLRPMTPDGTPVIGPTKVEGLYLNTGHGTLGWTMSCGSARVLCDLVSGREPDIDATDLSIGRYSRGA